MDAGPRGLLQ